MIAQLPGFQIGYDDHGDGQPVVLLHGFPHDRTLWTAQRVALAPQARCIVPDIRGFGHSSTHGPYSMDQYADDVVALLDYLGIERAVVCGLSMGGYIAMAMWRRHPDRVKALVFCDTRAGADTDDAKQRRDELAVMVKHGGTRVITDATAPAISEAERSTAARIGQVLFKNRGWLPVPFLAVPLLAPGGQSRTTWIVGLIIVALGELIRTAGVAAAGTVTRRRSREVQRLVTYGAFAWCRNPLYVGNFLAWIGFTVVSGVFWFIPVAIAIFAVEYTLIVRYEEGVLESIFGQEYLEYKARTPRWFGRPPAGATEGQHDWKEAFWSERSTILQYVVLIGAFWYKGQL